jgi:hypothetical protein
MAAVQEKAHCVMSFVQFKSTKTVELYFRSTYGENSCVLELFVVGKSVKANIFSKATVFGRGC